MTATVDASPSTDTLTHAMARFAVETEFDALPADVGNYTKLLIVDPLTCGIAASDAERTQMSHTVAERLGGPAEAAVFGMDTRVPSVPIRRCGPLPSGSPPPRTRASTRNGTTRSTSPRTGGRAAPGAR